MESMSIKIHHGFRLAAGTDVPTFQARLSEIMDRIRDGLDAALFAGLAVHDIDRKDMRGEARPEHPLAEAYAEWAEDQLTQNPLTVWHDPNSLDADFGFDDVTGLTFVLFHCQEDAYRDAFLKMDEVEEYGYWNSTEGPERLTEAEWAERREFWERTILRHSRVSDVTERWTLREDIVTRTREIGLMAAGTEQLLLDNAPSPSQRARRLGQESYAGWLHRETGKDMLSVVNQSFRADLTGLAAVIEPALAPVTVNLLSGGLGENGLAAVKDQFPELCAAIHAESGR